MRSGAAGVRGWEAGGPRGVPVPGGRDPSQVCERLTSMPAVPAAPVSRLVAASLPLIPGFSLVCLLTAPLKGARCWIRAHPAPAGKVGRASATVLAVGAWASCPPRELGIESGRPSDPAGPAGDTVTNYSHRSTRTEKKAVSSTGGGWRHPGHEPEGPRVGGQVREGGGTSARSPRRLRLGSPDGTEGGERQAPRGTAGDLAPRRQLQAGEGSSPPPPTPGTGTRGGTASGRCPTSLRRGRPGTRETWPVSPPHRPLRSKEDHLHPNCALSQSPARRPEWHGPQGQLPAVSGAEGRGARCPTHGPSEEEAKSPDERCGPEVVGRPWGCGPGAPGAAQSLPLSAHLSPTLISLSLPHPLSEPSRHVKRSRPPRWRGHEAGHSGTQLTTSTTRLTRKAAFVGVDPPDDAARPTP